MSNYKAYFKSIDCHEYEVRFITDYAASYTELELAGSSPVVITYDSPALLFEPIIQSRATIVVNSDGYLEDLFVSHVDDVVVDIYDNTANKLVWTGYLKPQIYSQGYVNCIESIEFEASDCLAALQYIDYDNVGSYKQIVTFRDIIARVCEKEALDGFYWAKTKKLGNNWLLPENLTISEQNFYTEDTDEPWKFSEVLEEMCRYLGYTLVQWGSYLFFLDMQAFHSSEVMEMYRYLSSENFSAGTQTTLNTPVVITKDSYMGSGHQISFEPVYNKATVSANFYFPKNFIPDIDEDDYRTNRLGGTAIQSIEVVPNSIRLKHFEAKNLYTPVYLDEDGKRQYDACDIDYKYYRRIMDNQYYEPVYYTYDLNPTTPSTSELPTSSITKNYISGQLIEYGSIENTNPNAISYELASNISMSKYLLIHQWDKPSFYTVTNLQSHVNDYPPVFKLKSGYRNPIIVDSNNSFLCLSANAMFERYSYRDYFNPDWTDEYSWGSAIRPYLNFKLGIGGKWWNGSGWTTTETSFWVKARTEEVEKGSVFMDGNNWNKDRDILNNVSFTDWTDADGYKIPLDNSIDMNGTITFMVNLPAKLQNMMTSEETSGINNWCWVSDLALTIHNKQASESDKDSDVVYGGEDTIDNDSILELNEIKTRFTTFAGNQQLSYSNVGDAVSGGFLTGITEPYLIPSYVSQKPEQNLITRFVNQYSTQTIKEQLTVKNNIAPYQKIYDSYWSDTKHFVWNGTEIDLAAGSQTITIVETK